MCSVDMNKQEVYNQIQKLEYDLDLAREEPEDNKQAIFDLEQRKLIFEELLEFAD